jgi:hypothetical protein
VRCPLRDVQWNYTKKEALLQELLLFYQVSKSIEE